MENKKLKVCVTFKYLLHYIAMPRILTVLFVFISVMLHAQDEDAVFTVRKAVTPPSASTKQISGIYCTVFNGDGRMCFHFDTTGQVNNFIGGKNLKDVPKHTSFFARDTTNYIYSGDTILFTVIDTLQEIILSKPSMYVRVDTYIGVVYNNRIEFSVSTTKNGMLANAYTVVATRVKED